MAMNRRLDLCHVPTEIRALRELVREKPRLLADAKTKSREAINAMNEGNDERLRTLLQEISDL